MSVAENLKNITQTIPAQVQLVAISKTKPVEVVMEAYHAGQRVFGENKVQEMVAKEEVMPKDIQWHLVGHLQTNKIKYIIPFVSLIHSVDSQKLLEAIDKEERIKQFADIVVRLFDKARCNGIIYIVDVEVLHYRNRD